MNPNVLRQWMQIYDRSGMGSGYEQPPMGAVSSFGAVPVTDWNAGARRMMFAERMAGQGDNQGGPPDFFGGQQSLGQPMNYQAPQVFNEQMPERRKPMNALRAMRMGG